MAIKIKREGNLSAAAYGSMVGGKGKRQIEDAKILASLQRGGGGGGGGTGGGARAGANVSLISAPSGGGGAPLGSVGGLVSPPRDGGYTSGVSSPGGRKKGYLGSTSARATMTDKDYGMYSLQQGGSAKRPVYNLLDNEGNVVRSYSQAQWDHLQKRGHSNSTMDRADSAAFFRSQGGQTAEEKAAAIRQGEQEFRASEAQKSRDAQAASQKQQQEWSSAEKQKDREAQTERLKQEKADREALEIRKLELQRQFKREEDARAARYEDLIRQGYSHGDAMSIVDLQEERSATIANKKNRLSDDQIQAGVAEIEGRIAKFKPTYKPQSDPNDPSSAIQQVTLADGKVVNLMRDSSGRWSEFVSQGEKDAQALKVAQARAENQEAIALRRESEKAAREERSFVAKFVADALKNYTPDSGEAAPDVETLRKQAIELYRGAYGGAATPTQTASSPEAKNAPAATAGGGKTKRPLAAGGVESYSDNKSGGEVVFGSNEGQPSGQGVGNAPKANAPKAFLPEGREGTKIYSQIPENVMSEFRRLYPDADGWDVIAGKYDKHLRRVAGRMGDTVTGTRLDNALAAERTPQKMKEVQDLVRDYRAQKQKEKEDAYLEELLAAQKEAEDEAFRIGVEKDYDDEAVKRTVVGLMDSQYAKLYRKYKITHDEGRRLLKNKNK